MPQGFDGSVNESGDGMVFVKKAAWDSLVLSLKKFTPDFMEGRTQPPLNVAKGSSENSARR